MLTTIIAVSKIHLEISGSLRPIGLLISDYIYTSCPNSRYRIFWVNTVQVNSEKNLKIFDKGKQLRNLNDQKLIRCHAVQILFSKYRAFVREWRITNDVVCLPMNNSLSFNGKYSIINVILIRGEIMIIFVRPVRSSTSAQDLRGALAKTIFCLIMVNYKNYL